jgi:alkylhydroperoxidase/carboxymuconolactone decarboxylase family protein YurZ
MTTERYQRGLDRMMELVSAEQSKTFDHVKLAESHKSLDPNLSDYIVSFAFGDIYSRKSLTQQEQTMVTISTLVAMGHRARVEAAHQRRLQRGPDQGENRRCPDPLHPLHRVPAGAQRPDPRQRGGLNRRTSRRSRSSLLRMRRSRSRAK